MAWQIPKTDWHGSTNSEGVYTGDRFNASDFNRMVQWSLPLHEQATEVKYVRPLQEIKGGTLLW